MGGNQLLYFYTTSRVTCLKRLAPFVPMSVRSYCLSNKGTTDYEHHAEEKAPTTAEEFIRVAEEMAEDKEHLRRVAEDKEKQGFASQTVDKAQDAMEAAFTGESKNAESVKERFKEPPGKGDFHRKGDESDDLLN